MSPLCLKYFIDFLTLRVRVKILSITWKFLHDLLTPQCLLTCGPILLLLSNSIPATQTLIQAHRYLRVFALIVLFAKNTKCVTICFATTEKQCKLNDRKLLVVNHSRPPRWPFPVVLPNNSQHPPLLSKPWFPLPAYFPTKNVITINFTIFLFFLWFFTISTPDTFTSFVHVPSV